jgi:hypothetical protein
MTFFDELYEKVNALRRAFRDRYAGDFGFMVREDGGLVLEETTSPEFDSRKEADAQAAFVELELLCGRLMQYDDLDPTPYHSMIVGLGVDRDAGEGAPSWSTFGFLDQTVDIQHMGGVVGMIDGGEWRAESARLFENGFVKLFGAVLQAQRKALYDLALLIETYHTATIRLKKDIKDILDNGTHVLRGRTIELDTLGVVSLVTAALSVYAFPELAIPYALDVLSLGTGFASVLQSADDVEQSGRYTIEGDDAPAILASIRTAVDKLESAMMASDQSLATMLQDGLASPSSYANPALDLQPPGMVSNPDFGRMWLTYDRRVPIEHDQVVASLVDLYEAGQRQIPDTATLYDAARAGIASARIPLTSYSRHWWYSEAPANQLVARLTEMLRNSRDTLVDVGQALVEIATGYELTDCQTAEFNRQVLERFRPENPVPVGFPV